ncbi:hypothetical protein [Actinomadura darangshiensis]|nr:hypothetical protein [Actinomadura darangshiensis]
MPALVAVVAGGGVTAAWRLGFFNADGRFDDLDACELMPDAAALTPLISNGAREQGDSQPRTLFGFGSGPTRSECKWSSVPAGVDRPFRTLRVFVETTHANSDGSGPEHAADSLRVWHDNRARRGSEMTSVEVGENGYGVTDKATYDVVLAHVEVFDVHVKFRVSNAVLDVSARTHDQPGAREQTQVEGLAKAVAARLPSGD